ncbi:MAG: alkaline phosphatase family protein [Polyangiales bacterium]
MKRLRFLVPILPLILALLALVLLDASDVTTPPEVTHVAEVGPTRLTILMVDALDRRDVERAERLPRLRARLGEAALHGPVLACVDGVTIPCVAAMITGFDRVSGFSPLRNFGAARGLAAHSVLGALMAHGVRVGYFGDPLLARALEGLTQRVPRDEVDDDATLHAGLTALQQGAVDIAFVHLLELDETAHKHTEHGSAYAAALTRLDARIARVLDARASEQHVVVLGDHGHAETGRHGAGLGTETYAAYFGPRLPRGVRRMAMTDHARIWAHVFGLRWGPPSWVDGHADAGGSALQVRARGVLPLIGVLVLALGMAVSTLDARMLAGRARVLAGGRALLLAIATMLALSIVVPRMWAWVGSDVGALALALVLGAVGGVLGRLADATRDPARLRSAALPLAGALLLALPTGEPTSGLKAPVLWLLLVLAARATWAARTGRMREAVEAMLGAVACGALALVQVRAYLPRGLLAHEAGTWTALVIPALLMVVAVATAGGRRAATLVAVGAAASWVLPLAARWWIAPCALVLLVTFAAFRRAWLFSMVCLLLPIACRAFFPDDSAQLAAVATSWVLWALVSLALRDTPLLLRGSAFVLLTWLSFWTAMSTRIGGIDYDFYFRWLPAGAGATSEAVQQGLLTAAKCMLPPVFGALLAHRVGALPLRVLKLAEHLVRLRLALTFVFVVGLSLGRGRVDVYLLYDATQEAAFWMLAFAVLGLLSAVHQLGLASRSAGAATS